uniref:inositol monophosphatase family protein n=1 Tax=Vaginimicrobium propionicum TaxID=1871034 RepID=UPI0009703754|nr:inositol monophosphatase family protein [Vaginimicrobium propionicum]
MADYTEDIRLAHLFADAADAITQERFRAQDLRVETKPDHTKVSDADKAVEETIRDMIARTRPRDGIHGEEFADIVAGPRRWIIDPIDSTANYLRGVPVWATLIALEVSGKIRAGLVSAPALGRRWWASEGSGAWAGKSLMRGERIHVSAVSNLSEAFVSYSSLHGWISSGRGQGFVDTLRDAGRTRAFGDFWSYMLVAEGTVDVATEPELALHDMAALDIIVREAGGQFTSIDGQPGPVGPGALATNSRLHEELLVRLRPAD